ncbi:MAG: alpha/beta hydrolase family protein, partial [Anaerolineae bacterium]
MSTVPDLYPALYTAVQPEFACRAANPAELAAWQAAFRPALRRALGLERLEADLAHHQPHAERRSSEPCEGYTREEWTLTVEPDLPLPFYL